MTTNTSKARDKALDKVRADKRVLNAWDEGEDGLWALLKVGWQWDDVHAIHESTPKAFLASLARVKECRCKECLVTPLFQVVPTVE